MKQQIFKSIMFSQYHTSGKPHVVTRWYNWYWTKHCC